MGGGSAGPSKEQMALQRKQYEQTERQLQQQADSIATQKEQARIQSEQWAETQAEKADAQNRQNALAQLRSRGALTKAGPNMSSKDEDDEEALLKQQRLLGIGS